MVLSENPGFGSQMERQQRASFKNGFYKNKTKTALFEFKCKAFTWEMLSLNFMLDSFAPNPSKILPRNGGCRLVQKGGAGNPGSRWSWPALQGQSHHFPSKANNTYPQFLVNVHLTNKITTNQRGKYMETTQANRKNQRPYLCISEPSS